MEMRRLPSVRLHRRACLSLDEKVRVSELLQLCEGDGGETQMVGASG